MSFIDEFDEFILYVKPLLLMPERRRSKECCVATFMKYFLMQYHSFVVKKKDIIEKV